jgi:hypothetical protein
MELNGLNITFFLFLSFLLSTHKKRVNEPVYILKQDVTEWNILGYYQFQQKGPISCG